MAGDIKINKSVFSLPKDSRGAAGGRRGAFEGPMCKSSYSIPQETQWALKMLSVERHVKMNVLIQEAFSDLLAKYGKR